MNGAHRFPSAVSLILPVTAEGRQEDMEKRPGRLEQVHRFLFSVPYYAVSLLLWPVLWGGWLLSVWLAYRWVHVSLQYVQSLSTIEFQALVSGLLHTAELLLLIPLPGIVGSAAFRNIRAYSDPNAQERDSAETDIALAKRLILGILVTVTGTAC